MKKFIIVLILIPHLVLAQKIDNMASFRDAGKQSYFRLTYDNDYFTATDKNYTQGINLEIAGNWLKNNPINKILLQPNNNRLVYGLAVEHLAFTPKKIGESAIQKGDRPYAAAIMVKSFIIATDVEQKSRLVSALNVGLIGTAAFGKSMQSGIHGATGDVIPLGWHNQIKNDLVLNWEVTYEKQLFSYRNLIRVQSNAQLKVGTLFSNASAGFNAVVGKTNELYIDDKKRSKFQFYFYTQPLITVVVYDATLQGGVFNKQSPYEIPTSDIDRVVGQLNFGIVLQTNRLYFEYARTKVTREFKTNTTAAWGGVKLGWKF